MKKSIKWVMITAAVVLLAAVIALLMGGEENFSEKYAGVDLNTDISGIGRGDSYSAYLNSHTGAKMPSTGVTVDITRFMGDGEMVEDGVYCADSSAVTWEADVPEEGMYQIRITYLTVSSRGIDPTRRLTINGEVPFSGASSLCFSRLWADSGEVVKDNQGNEIRPSHKEIFEVQSAFCKDDMGYVTEPYRFFFEKGINTIGLAAVNEPIIICGIELTPVSERRTYEEYASGTPEVVMSEEAESFSLTIQGESAYVRSSPSLYARYDRSSPATEPYNLKNTVLNYIGGDSWNSAGQWIEWEFEVPEDGCYNITIKARQIYQRGSVSYRTVYLDGEVPFDALYSVAFPYGTKWDSKTLSDETGNAYRFYLTAGRHTIRMEATLGDNGQLLQDIENSIYRLNLMYRKILVLTGTNPDSLRDYNIKGIYPEVIEGMDLESKRLYKIVDDAVAVMGEKNDRIAVAQTLAVQLEQFVAKNSKITRNLTSFKDNITSLGTALQEMSECKLDVDLIVVSGENGAIPESKEGFLATALHEIRSCFASFVVDYNSLGNKYDEDGEVKPLTVWLVTGRDQSNVLKNMIDNGFTAETGIPVNMKLVQSGAVLMAIAAGNGPDIVLGMDNSVPVNYAMRNAVEDLSAFNDFEEVTLVYYESALTPYRYCGGVYALPETQTFSVLFYRTDILEELELDVPETWTDVIDMLPTLQGNNMTMGIRYPEITNPDLSVYNSLLFQNGGSVYDEDGKKTMIDSEAGVEAFKFYTSLYTDYGLPTGYDFVSRFRSGEMPIGIDGYATYNTLMVSAPEIRGLWDFTLIPGTLLEDGSVDHSVQSNGVCSIMIHQEDEKQKQNAWEFMKWWACADTQVQFGREIESIMGASARYATANTSALPQLSWTDAQLEVLTTQMASTVGVPEIAGGYSRTRHITNAIRKVINDKDDPREVLTTYTKTINEEIKTKRKEFDLPID